MCCLRPHHRTPTECQIQEDNGYKHVAPLEQETYSVTP